MDKVAIAFAVFVLTIGGVFLLIIFSTLMGALAGWVVGLFFSETILGILSQLGIRNIAMWQFGAFMGFVGGFLKTKVTATVNSD
jgi:hypothetical protein